MEENFALTTSFYAYPRLRRILAWALASYPRRVCCSHVRTKEYIIFASCLNIFGKLMELTEQRARQRLSRDLFQNEHSCAF